MGAVIEIRNEYFTFIPESPAMYLRDSNCVQNLLLGKD